jgi:hypothetical protein
MRKGGGKQKGAAFERDICKRLSLWLSEGKQEDCLWRSAMSGGRSTVAAAKGKRLAAQAGDITAINDIGLRLTKDFFIECKAYKNLNYAGLITGTGKFVEFWKTACVQAQVYNKRPMLIVKQNQQPVLVCLRGLTTDFGRATLKRVLWMPKLNMEVYLFEDFLKHAGVPK